MFLLFFYQLKVSINHFLSFKKHFRSINKTRHHSDRCSDIHSDEDEQKTNGLNSYDQADNTLKRKHESNEKTDFLEFHKANGHPSLEVLKKQAERCKIELTDEVECQNCTSHQLMIKCLNGLKEPELESRDILDVVYTYVSC